MDENQNAAIKYGIYDAQNTGVKDIFGINESTGGVFLQKGASEYGISTVLYLFFQIN